MPEAPQLPLLAREIFDDLGLTSYFEIRPATFANFIREVSAVLVCAYCARVLCTLTLAEFSRAREELALPTSCVLCTYSPCVM